MTFIVKQLNFFPVLNTRNNYDLTKKRKKMRFIGEFYTVLDMTHLERTTVSQTAHLKNKNK